MKAKEAIKWVFDIWHEWENVYGVDVEANLVSGNEMEEVINILKKVEKLEAENKDFRSWNRKLALENEELKNIREQCIDENKALKKENKAYKGMWGEHKKETEKGNTLRIDWLENKYLGGQNEY
jgi:microcompartment protein CcmL/EutN